LRRDIDNRTRKLRLAASASSGGMRVKATGSRTLSAAWFLQKRRMASAIVVVDPRCYIRDPDGYIIEVGQSKSGFAAAHLLGWHEEVREEPMKSETNGINPAAEPSGTGCVECLALGGWWLHLRRCAECGHIGCCDNSPNQHASKHNASTGHPIITSFEPGERWFYDYRTEQFLSGPKLHTPHSHPLDQPVPGPAGAVPSNWQTLLHE